MGFERLKEFAEWSAASLETVGIAVVVIHAVLSLMSGLLGMIRKSADEDPIKQMRLGLGRGILLGLEFLVAADIIHTVAVELTFETVGILTVIVIVRTFLSFTLEVELTGRWPWQRNVGAENT